MHHFAGAIPSLSASPGTWPVRSNRPRRPAGPSTEWPWMRASSSSSSSQPRSRPDLRLLRPDRISVTGPVSLPYIPAPGRPPMPQAQPSVLTAARKQSSILALLPTLCALPHTSCFQRHICLYPRPSVCRRGKKEKKKRDTRLPLPLPTQLCCRRIRVFVK